MPGRLPRRAGKGQPADQPDRDCCWATLGRQDGVHETGCGSWSGGMVGDGMRLAGRAVGPVVALGLMLAAVSPARGVVWSAQPTAVSGGMAAASCVSARACIAVGEVGYKGGPGAMGWDGRRWTQESVPNPGPAPSDAESPEGLSGVSCTSSTACIAVGQYDSAGHRRSGGTGTAGPCCRLRRRRAAIRASAWGMSRVCRAALVWPSGGLMVSRSLNGGTAAHGRLRACPARQDWPNLRSTLCRAPRAVPVRRLAPTPPAV